MAAKESETISEGADTVSKRGGARESGSGFRDVSTRTLDDADELTPTEKARATPLTILDDLDLSYDPVAQEMSDAASDGLVTVQVSRVYGQYPDGTPTERGEFLEEGPPSHVRLSRLKAVYGGGLFRFRFLDRAHKYLKQVTRPIAGPARRQMPPATERTHDPAAPAPAAAPTLDQDLARLAKLQEIVGGGKSEGVLTGQIAQLRELRETYESLEDLFGTEAEEPAGDTVSEQAQIRIANKLIDLGERWLEDKVEKKKAGGKATARNSVTEAASATSPASPPPVKDEVAAGRAAKKNAKPDNDVIPLLIEKAGESVLLAFHSGVKPDALAAKILKDIPPARMDDLRAFLKTFKKAGADILRNRALLGAGAEQAGREEFDSPAGRKWVHDVVKALKKAVK